MAGESCLALHLSDTYALRVVGNEEGNQHPLRRYAPEARHRHEEGRPLRQHSVRPSLPGRSPLLNLFGSTNTLLAYLGTNMVLVIVFTSSWWK